MENELRKIERNIVMDVRNFEVYCAFNNLSQEEINSVRDPLLDRIEEYKILLENSDKTIGQKDLDFKGVQKIKNNLIKNYSPTRISI
jgi:hypothetical protein